MVDQRVSDAALTKFAWLSIAAAILTIALKAIAWKMTGSVGLLSDALESVVNLIAAITALWMLKLAERPPDEEYAYGYSKAEYFSSGFEGGLIFLAAIAIVYSAVPRLIQPQPLEQVGLGLAVSALASAINLGVGLLLLRVGKSRNSITLEADGHHLLTDVWTSVGVIVAVGAVVFTGWLILDPIIAIAVALNILWIGFKLVRRSMSGLLDRALPADARQAIRTVFSRHEEQGIQFHALRTRQAAGRSFVSVHVLVPGAWSVQKGHELVETVEREVREAVPGASVITHLEPVEDPASFDDAGLDR